MSGRGRGSRGRGAYYKARYGSGRGHGSDGHERGSSQQSHASSHHQSSTARDWNQLQRDLSAIDAQQYGAYKRLLGCYSHPDPRFALHVDHVQSDAYASPSRVKAVMLWADTGIPDEYIEGDTRKIATCDFITRVAATFIREQCLNENVGGLNSGWSAPKGGAFSISNCGQEVIPRTSAMISNHGTVELRFTVALPAAGRTILGKHAFNILVVNLVQLVTHSLVFTEALQQDLRQHVLRVEAQTRLRQEMAKNGLVAFVANGAILPRVSGSSQAPMDEAHAVPFQSPPQLETELQIPDARGRDSPCAGMGIPPGVTVLTGGGFHGKSTLLEALQLGVYNHVPGDGRHLVVTEPTAVKIRAEDGRSVAEVDIRPFVSALPGAKSTAAFSSEDASGSTSMAANIQEALEVGCKLLLIDEDTSATNLLVRDQRMQALVRDEPIKPLTSKVRALYSEHGVSTIIVVGGLGDWLSVADNVITMESYIPRHANDEAQAVIRQYPRDVAQAPSYGSLPNRAVQVNFAGHRPPFAVRSNFIAVKSQTKSAVDDPSQSEKGIDLGALDQLVEIGQTRMIALLLQRVEQLTTSDGPLQVRDLIRRLQQYVGTDACLDLSLTGGDLVAVRPAEFAAALFRMRGTASITCCPK